MINKESYVDKHDEEKIDFGLDRIYKLLNVVGNPQDCLKVIHIAGTNGKGSVSSYLAHILAYSGMRVGKISSPVIFTKMEFAQIYTLNTKLDLQDDVCIQDANENQFNNLVNVYKSDIELIKPSGYELQIALSLKYFKDEQCDIVIVETGMGGSLDATNVFKNTLCDVLTSISLDHIGMIGNNIEEIALCKCGIITTNGNVVTTSTNKQIINIIQDTCRECNSKLEVASLDKVDNIKLELDNNSFEYFSKYNNEDIGGIKFITAMNGRHQIENAIIAIEVIKVLNLKGYNISLGTVKLGLRKTKQKARFDVIKNNVNSSDNNDDTMIILDGAHNHAGAKTLACGLDDYIDRDTSRIIYALSMFKDKEYKKVIKEIISNADEIWTFETTNPRCLESKKLYNEVVEQISKAIQLEELDKAIIVKNIETLDNIKENIDNIQSSYNKNNVVVCAGSLSFMKDIYGRLIKNG